LKSNISEILPPGRFLFSGDLIMLKSPARIQSSKDEVSKLKKPISKRGLSIRGTRAINVGEMKAIA
jgi:hypothetical protein